MTRITLKNRLANFLRKYHSQQFISSGELQHRRGENDLHAAERWAPVARA
jgi:hypothetical protein